MKAFLKRYVEIYDAAMATGETAEFRGLGTNCEECGHIADQIEEVYEAGGHITTNSRRFTGWSMGQNGLNDGRPSCTVVYQSSSTTWVRRPGAKPETYPGGKIEKLITLQWADEGWTIIGLFSLPSE